jgi:predicted Zn-dependent protease
MKRTLGLFTVLAALVIAPSISAAPVHDDAAVKKAMEDEMARATSQLKLGKDGPPYFVSYAILDDDRMHASARLGTLVYDDHTPARSMSVELRVGSPDEDNTNFRGGNGGRASAGISRDDDYAALRRDLWETTDREYKEALETLARKKASKTIESADKDKMPDFAKAAPVTLTSDKAGPAPSDADLAKLRELVVKTSAVFAKYPAVQNGRVDGGSDHLRRRYLSSEKTWTDEHAYRCGIDIHADTTTPDGHRVGASRSFAATSLAALLADEAKILQAVDALAKNLSDQRTAPLVEAGSATVLFEGQAAAQIARLMLGGSLVGQPDPRSADSGPRDGSSSFADKIGLRVAPTWLSVTDDPTAKGHFGTYDTDDEGVPGEKVKLLEHGVVKTLLMSRTPRKEIPKSNGHGRSNGWGVRAAASNVFVTADGGLARKDLLAAAQRSAGPKGTVYVVQALDPTSSAARGQLVTAQVAFRLKDGKEEPVRGLALEGFVPKKMKKDLIAAGKDTNVLEDDGFGAPSAFVSPSLLFEDVDVAKPNEKSRIPPLYKSPLEDGK